MNPEAWSNGLSVLLVMHERPSGGGYTLSVEQAEALALQLQSAIRSAKAAGPIIQNLMRPTTEAEVKRDD